MRIPKGVEGMNDQRERFTLVLPVSHLFYRVARTTISLVVWSEPRHLGAKSLALKGRVLRWRVVRWRGADDPNGGPVARRLLGRLQQQVGYLPYGLESLVSGAGSDRSPTGYCSADSETMFG